MNSGWKRLTKKQKKSKKEAPYYEETEVASNEEALKSSLEENLKKIMEALGNSEDVVVRNFTMGKPFVRKVASIYINGLTDKEILGRGIIKQLMSNANLAEEEEFSSPSQVGAYIKEHMLTITNVKDVVDWNKLFFSLLSGETIVLIDGWNQGFTCAAQGGDLRAISEPVAESSVRGPRDSFTESLISNTAMVRRRIKSPNLWLETMELGEITQTTIGIMYVKGIVNDKLLTEVKERLHKIKVDEVQSSNTIEEWISDETWTPWPTIFVTERPDVVAGNLLEGRIVIFVNETPIPLIVPATWNQFFQTAEDYYLRWTMASFLRLLRITSFLITLLGPSLFVAFLSFHPELIPTPLLVNLAAQRQNIPFPIIIEALLMEFTFEVLREAGIRMPRPVGQAVSIVGALVLGEAAVSAGIVSSAMVIVVAATAIASFTIPHYGMTDATRMLRFGMMIMASFFGLYGIGLGVIVLVAHTCSLRSFGIPYLTPFAPIVLADQKDSIIRWPLPFLSKRPRLISQVKTKRVDHNQDRGPSKREGNMKNQESKRDSNET
ncbi:spore germination protein [Priestia endophytica]|uniref:spore germination protein n=1 Tax=Priestia endophytica TaxID=135735 RepID=UPI00203CA402|nr:spore germination protein [Priestia endophytica]MCM3537820.1 spore germination protein [Priestia endophytica]